MQPGVRRVERYLEHLGELLARKLLPIRELENDLERKRERPQRGEQSTVSVGARDQGRRGRPGVEYATGGSLLALANAARTVVTIELKARDAEQIGAE